MENSSPGVIVIDELAYMEDALQLQQVAPDGTVYRTGVSRSNDCTASNNPEAPVCWLFHQLPTWNNSLRYVSLQLEEVDAPGKLSLVRVDHDVVAPHQELYRRHARCLFYTLVVAHHCVTRVDLTNALFEGGTLDDIRRLPLRALLDNSSLRILNVIAFPNGRILQSALMTIFATMISLQELSFTTCPDVLRLVKPLQTLIMNTTALKKLDISELHLGDSEWKRLLAALIVNRTVTALSVHTNIMIPRSSSDVAYFSRYLKTATWLASLTVKGFLIEEAYDFVRDIVEPLLVTRTLVELTLVDFRLDSRCLALLGRLVAHSDILEFLNIAGCYALPVIETESPPRHGESAVEQKRQAESGHMLSFVRGFEVSRSLKLLTIDLGEFPAHDIRALIKALARVESLRKVIFVGILSDSLREYGESVREAGMSGLVSLPQPYRVSPAVLAALKNCPGLNGVVVDTHINRHWRMFNTVIHRLPTWIHLTSLWLHLDHEKLDNATVTTIRGYVSATTALKDLRLLGYNKPDLSVCTVGADKPHSLLLEALFLSKSISCLQVKEFLFGEENLRFFAESVRNSASLCDVYISPIDEGGHTSFIRYLAPGFARNRTILSLRDPYSTSEIPEYQTTEEHFFVEDVLIRNRGLITCAAEFVIGNALTDRCAGALEFLSCSHGLVERVIDLACVDEHEAVAMIRRRMQELDGNVFFPSC